MTESLQFSRPSLMVKQYHGKVKSLGSIPRVGSYGKGIKILYRPT